MEYALCARDPINYFMLLRALFRSIGGGLHDILYSQFLPLLPDLMLFFNKLQVLSGSKCIDFTSSKYNLVVRPSPNDARTLCRAVLDGTCAIIYSTSTPSFTYGATCLCTQWRTKFSTARLSYFASFFVDPEEPFSNFCEAHVMLRIQACGLLNYAWTIYNPIFYSTTFLLSVEAWCKVYNFMWLPMSFQFCVVSSETQSLSKSLSFCP